MSAIWNARQVLGVTPEQGFTCVGVTQRGERCHNPVHRDVRAQAGYLLDTISRIEPNSVTVREMVRQLTPRTLCKRYHRGTQDGRTYEKFMASIAAHLSTTRVSTLPAATTQFYPVSHLTPAPTTISPQSYPPAVPQQTYQNITTPPLIRPNAMTLAAMQPLLRLIARTPPPNEQLSQFSIAMQPLLQLWLQHSPHQSNIQPLATSPSSRNSTAMSTPLFSPVATASTTLSTPAATGSPSATYSYATPPASQLHFPPMWDLALTPVSSFALSPVSTLSLSGFSSGTHTPASGLPFSPAPTPPATPASAPQHSEAVAASSPAGLASSHRPSAVSLYGVQRRPITDDCPVCFDGFCCERSAVWCQRQCGYNVHRSCFEEWRSNLLQLARERQMNDGEEVEITMTCVCCRGVWVEE